MKIPFDIKHRDKIENGEYKVETYSGYPVIIYRWDYKDKYNTPILGSYIFEDGYEYAGGWDINGKFEAEASDFDLVIITGEEEPLTPLAELLSTYLKNDFEYFTTKKWDEKKWNEVMKTQATELQRVAYLEKQKEQKPELVQHPSITYTYPSDASRDEQLKRALIALLNSDLIKVAGNKFTKQDLIDRVEKQMAVEWSEEDEKMLEEIINHIYTTSIQRIPARPGSDIGKSWIKFLKSLRPCWKPSEGQMMALRDSLDFMPEYFKPKCTLESLYEQLKKLM